LIRIEYWPDLLPLSFSKRLPGGTRKVLSSVAALSIKGFRCATLCNSGPSDRTGFLSQTFSFFIPKI